MSLEADIIDDVLGKFLTALPTATIHNALTDKFRNEDSINKATEYPFMEGFGASIEVAPVDLGQSETIITTQYFLLRLQQLDQVTPPGEAMWLNINLLQANLNFDPSLGGLVNRTLITAAAVDEVTDVNRTFGLIEVQSFLVQP